MITYEQYEILYSENNYLKRENAELKRIIISLIKANGGRVTISDAVYKEILPTEEIYTTVDVENNQRELFLG